mgnify:CR=1 FL=1
MKNRVYADNAATSLMDLEALEAMVSCIRGVYANPAQHYSPARQAKRLLDSSREAIADCIGAHSNEIFFTSGGSESNNWAIKGSYHPGDARHTILTSSIEHHSVLLAADSMSELGEKVLQVSPDSKGIVHPEYLMEALDDSVRLVSIMMANNEVGSIQPISELCRIAHQSGALFHTDAVQAVGHVPINVEELGIDMLSASAHKFNGPRGFGFLYVRHGTNLKPLICGGAQQDGMRAGTDNLPSAYSASIALRNNCRSMKCNADKLHGFEKRFFSILNDSGIDYIQNGSDEHIPGLISISIKGRDGEALLNRLDLMGFSVSTGSACNSGNSELSHVIRSMGVDKSYANGTVRISFGKYNTVIEVERLANSLIRIVSEDVF